MTKQDRKKGVTNQIAIGTLSKVPNANCYRHPPPIYTLANLEQVFYVLTFIVQFKTMGERVFDKIAEKSAESLLVSLI